MREEINPEKLRDMIRSILPSTYRSGPRRAKATRKRRHRRKVRGDLRHQDPETTKAALTRDVRVGDIVSWRRGGDKLSHFLRWCERITKGMTADEALAFVRGLLPASVIGDHAYSHWEVHRKPRYSWFAGGRRRSPERELQSYRDSTTFRLHRALRLDPELHARLNAEIKRRKALDEPRRLLAGAHDVEAFVEDVRTQKCGHYQTERSIMLRLITETEKGGRKVALRILGAASRRTPCPAPHVSLRERPPQLLTKSPRTRGCSRWTEGSMPRAGSHQHSTLLYLGG